MERLRGEAVIRQVHESAAVSQSLRPFFLNLQRAAQQVAAILDGFAPLVNLLKPDNIA